MLLEQKSRLLSMDDYSVHIVAGLERHLPVLQLFRVPPRC